MNLPAFQALSAYHSARAIAAKPNEAALPATEDVKNGGSAFSAVHALAEAVAQGEKMSTAYLAGNADPHSVVEALARAELAVDTAVSIRDKVVEAYQELLRMPV